MFVASLILILSAAMCMVYVQAICQKILRREFAYDYFQSVVNVNRLAFAAVRGEVESSGSSRDYTTMCTALNCDFAALSYQLKHGPNAKQHHGAEEILLMAYFRAIFWSLTLRHALKFREKPAIIKLTSVLQYFSNVVGQRAVCASEIWRRRITR